jgi:hypothetical protein
MILSSVGDRHVEIELVGTAEDDDSKADHSDTEEEESVADESVMVEDGLEEQCASELVRAA